MSALPGRPDLDQLRRQARELLRAAAASDEQALGRIGAVSHKQTLSAAQLAIAREYGFPSWPKLRAEVLRRQAGTEPKAGAVAVAGTAPATELAPKSWQEMREWCARLLESRTGHDVAAWNERIAAGSPRDRADEPALRKWLSAQGVTGYAQALLVWETFGYPGFLVADAEELIGKQYADRPHLRPVFDAVLRTLAALPGPVTVQARGTLVSLVSPRRTFAVLKPTTKSRVDLGLRLGPAQPEGRILPARDLGQATVRIPLTTCGEIDDEVIAWLTKAYDENTAPPTGKPRPPARPKPVLGTMTVIIEGTELPGLTCQPEPGGTVHRNVHVALATTAKGIAEGQPWLNVPLKPGLAAGPFPGDAKETRWEVTVTVRGSADGGYDFTGPSVGGDRTDRNLGLAWGDTPGDGTLQMFRGAKLRLVDIPPDVITEAMRPGYRLIARVRLTDDKGNPVCARLRPSHLTWSGRVGLTATPVAAARDHDAVILADPPPVPENLQAKPGGDRRYPVGKRSEQIVIGYRRGDAVQDRVIKTRAWNPPSGSLPGLGSTCAMRTVVTGVLRESTRTSHSIVSDAADDVTPAHFRSRARTTSCCGRSPFPGPR